MDPVPCDNERWPKILSSAKVDATFQDLASQAKNLTPIVITTVKTISPTAPTHGNSEANRR